MGNLGGRALNVSSGLDLSVIYHENCDTKGTHAINNQQYSTQVSKRLIVLLNKGTAKDQLVCVDMCPRSYGSAASVTINDVAPEIHLVQKWQKWERHTLEYSADAQRH